MNVSRWHWWRTNDAGFGFSCPTQRRREHGTNARATAPSVPALINRLCIPMNDGSRTRKANKQTLFVVLDFCKAETAWGGHFTKERARLTLTAEQTKIQILNSAKPCDAYEADRSYPRVGRYMTARVVHQRVVVWLEVWTVTVCDLEWKGRLRHTYIIKHMTRHTLIHDVHTQGNVHTHAHTHTYLIPCIATGLGLQRIQFIYIWLYL